MTLATSPFVVIKTGPRYAPAVLRGDPTPTGLLRCLVLSDRDGHVEMSGFNYDRAPTSHASRYYASRRDNILYASTTKVGLVKGKIWARLPTAADAFDLATAANAAKPTEAWFVAWNERLTAASLRLANAREAEREAEDKKNEPPHITSLRTKIAALQAELQAAIGTHRAGPFQRVSLARRHYDEVHAEVRKESEKIADNERAEAYIRLGIQPLVTSDGVDQ